MSLWTYAGRERVLVCPKRVSLDYAHFGACVCTAPLILTCPNTKMLVQTLRSITSLAFHTSTVNRSPGRALGSPTCPLGQELLANASANRVKRIRHPGGECICHAFCRQGSQITLGENDLNPSLVPFEFFESFVRIVRHRHTHAAMTHGIAGAVGGCCVSCTMNVAASNHRNMRHYYHPHI